MNKTDNPYTRSQIEAALIVSDYHAKHGGVTPEQCDQALEVLNGAPLSGVLAWALRQSIADTARLDYLETTKGWGGHANLVHSYPSEQDLKGGWVLTTDVYSHETARQAIDFSMKNTASKLKS